MLSTKYNYTQLEKAPIRTYFLQANHLWIYYCTTQVKTNITFQEWYLSISSYAINFKP